MRNVPESVACSRIDPAADAHSHFQRILLDVITIVQGLLEPFVGIRGCSEWTE